MGRADSGGGGREQLYATIIDIGALAVATLLTFQLFSRLDRRRVDCRPCGAGGARNQSEKAKALADKLKHKGGKDGLKLSLKSPFAFMFYARIIGSVSLPKPTGLKFVLLSSFRNHGMSRSQGVR